MKLVRKKTQHLKPIIRVILLSLLLTITFGIGIIASGGNPGFGFPAPIILAILFTNPDLIVFSAIVPFFVWWAFFFIVELLRLLIQRHKSTSERNIE